MLAFAKTLWLWDDETLKVMLAKANSYINDDDPDSERGGVEDAAEMQEALVNHLAWRGSTITLNPDGTFSWG